ncbi:MAG TPA: phosphatase PAP2 family protein [Firmicutes bacterium]|nr:phosphatase PAP2 family protein [Candidatus Fermentithermobacillaceae bacterium]
MATSWAEFLQGLGSPAVDKLVYMITSIGSEFFYGIALAFTYWVWDKRKGYRLGMVFLSSMFVNSWLKFVFSTPRPTPYGKLRVIYPETGGGFSFPSGHAQGTTTFWGWLSHEVRKKGFYVMTGIIIVMVAASRIYLNVHWPIDVVGGFVIALLWIGLWKLVFRGYDETKWPVELRLVFATLVPLLMYWMHPRGDSGMLAGLLVGLPLGRYLDERYLMWTEKASTRVQCAKGVLGTAGFAVLRYGLKAVFNVIHPESGILDIVRYALVALWVSYGAPFVFVKLGWQARNGTCDS